MEVSDQVDEIEHDPTQSCECVWEPEITNNEITAERSAVISRDSEFENGLPCRTPVISKLYPVAATSGIAEMRQTLRFMPPKFKVFHCASRYIHDSEFRTCGASMKHATAIASGWPSDGVIRSRRDTGRAAPPRARIRMWTKTEGRTGYICAWRVLVQCAQARS